MTDHTDKPRTGGITPLTALRLIDSLNQLRDDIAVQGAILESIDVAMTALYAEFRAYHQARRSNV